MVETGGDASATRRRAPTLRHRLLATHLSVLVVGLLLLAVPYAVTDPHVSWEIGFAVAGIAAVGYVTSAALARRLSGPFERLADATRGLARGEAVVNPVSTGVAEADDLVRHLTDAAYEVDARLERERRFAADLSHQLRGPLASLRIGLEVGAATSAEATIAVRRALVEIDRLERTVDDLVRLSRDTGRTAGRCHPDAVVSDAVESLRSDPRNVGRPVVLSVEPGVPAMAISEPALRQVVEVLVDNAWRHGRGQVTVDVREVGPGVVVEVGDEGSLTGDEPLFQRRVSGAGGTGIGLALARSLVAVDGGRLVASPPGRPTRFRVVARAADRPASRRPSHEVTPT